MTQLTTVREEGYIPPPFTEQAIIDAFHRLYWSKKAWAIQWRGHNLLKWPADLFAYAGLIHKNRPDVLVETGTYMGGSAMFYADCMARAGKGCVISIDCNPGSKRPEHPRVIYLHGDSVELAVMVREEIARLEAEMGERLNVMVSLDSAHDKAHVAAELNAYKDIVTRGQYMVVEDTNLNGHPVHPEFGPGPWEAVQEFDDPRFRADEQIPKRHLFSMHTWLRKEAS